MTKFWKMIIGLCKIVYTYIWYILPFFLTIIIWFFIILLYVSQLKGHYMITISEQCQSNLFFIFTCLCLSFFFLLNFDLIIITYPRKRTLQDFKRYSIIASCISLIVLIGLVCFCVI